ncbi:MAG: beta strand repeat-containing protein, partial [Paludibacter sp.]
MKKITILVLCASLFFSMANAKNIFVDPTNGVDTQNGVDWNTPVKTLAGAVNATYVGTLTAGDNIYVKGGSLTTLTGTFTTNATVNYYGGCDLANTGTTTTRTTNDNDGNGITEPWEFLNPTTFSTTSNANGSVAIKINNAGYTFDGFTLTHNATAVASNYIRSIEITGTNTNFSNCIIKNSTVTYSISSFAGTPYNMLFSVGSGALVNNCLFEKNNVSYTTTTTGAAYPFINISSASFTNCIVRNNLVTVNASAANQVRSMLICLQPSSTINSTIKNCVIHNNEMVYDVATNTTSNVGAAINVYGVDGSESIINCTIANNKSTNVPIAGMKTTSRTGMNNTILNNVLWNNTYGASTVANFTVGAAMIATSSISKNVMNGGQTVTENGTTIKYNDFALSTTNATGANQPLFKTPTTVVGSSLASLSSSDSTIIKQSNWKLQSSTSYLFGKGISVTTNTKDIDGKNFEATPAVGAYEFKTTPVLTFSQDLSTLKMGDSPVGLTATSSAVSNAAPITFTSSNSSVVSVSGSTLTVVGPGTATVTAQQVANAYYEAAADVTQNVTVSIINAGFEDATSGYTVSESSLNVLRRVTAIQNTTTETANPNSVITVTPGMWVKKAPNTTYVKGIVTTTDPHSGTSCMNFRIANGTTNTNYDNWTSNTVSQKLSLTNTQKYTVSFWAKKDPQASNVASLVTTFLTDNTKRTNLSCAIPLAGDGTTWTQYSATFDIPTFKAANATADFTTAFLGVGLTTTYDAATARTNYSGILLDDIFITPTSDATVAINASASTVGTVTNGGVYASGASATVVAVPNNGYRFVNWTENGTEVSTSASYSFTVRAARTLVANFAATTTSVSISSTTLTGFTYNFAAGPSAEQSFTVSGTNLTSNISIAPSANYQISTGTGGSFVATSPIILTQSGGTVGTTTIYVRLKSGLAVANYNSETLAVNAFSLATQNVTCSGSVTTNPNLAFATPTSVSKTYGDAAFSNLASSSLSAGAVTYISGNTAVATINASTGEVAIVGAGSSVITATIAANGSYGAATTTYTLTVAAIAPNLAFATATSVSKNYGDAAF